MPRVDPQEPLLPSLLDRLIDHNPDVSTEPDWQRGQSLREYEKGVLRDIEALLNTRQSRAATADDTSEVARSVLTYGMPDVTNSMAGSLDDSERLRQSVARAIEHFEPRIRQVEVKLYPRENENDRSMRISVEGLLWIQPEPQRIVFDTIVEPLSGQCTVKAK